MTTISVHEAKTHLSRYIQRVLEGDEIYIGRYGREEVKLVGADYPTHSPRRVRVGVWEHKWKPGDFDDDDVISSDPEISAEFEASAERPFPA